MATLALSLPIHHPFLFLHLYFCSPSKAPAISPLASFIIFISTCSCIYFSFTVRLLSSRPFPGYPRFSQRGFKLQVSLHTALIMYHLNIFCVPSPDSGIWSTSCTDRPSVTDSTWPSTNSPLLCFRQVSSFRKLFCHSHSFADQSVSLPFSPVSMLLLTCMSPCLTAIAGPNPSASLLALRQRYTWETEAGEWRIWG